MPALTPEERDAAVAELESSRGQLLAALHGLSGQAWSRHPDGGGWSVAECAEHVAAAELPIARFLSSPAIVAVSGEERREIRKRNDFVRRFLRDRSQRGRARDLRSACLDFPLPGSKKCIFKSGEKHEEIARTQPELRVDFYRQSDSAPRILFVHKFRIKEELDV